MSLLDELLSFSDFSFKHPIILKHWEREEKVAYATGNLANYKFINFIKFFPANVQLILMFLLMFMSTLTSYFPSLHPSLWDSDHRPCL